jgi:hypothetical protein
MRTHFAVRERDGSLAAREVHRRGVPWDAQPPTKSAYTTDEENDRHRQPSGRPTGAELGVRTSRSPRPSVLVSFAGARDVCVLTIAKAVAGVVLWAGAPTFRPMTAQARSAQDRGLIAGAASASRHPRRSRSCARGVGCSRTDRPRTFRSTRRSRPRSSSTTTSSYSASSACPKDRRTGACPDVSRAQRRGCVGWKGLGRPTAPGAIVASKSMQWRPLSAAEASRHNLGLRRARSTTA